MAASEILQNKPNRLQLFAEWVLKVCLLGYLLEIYMFYEVMKNVLDDIPKFWCFVNPFPNELIPIVLFMIITGIVASIILQMIKRRKYIRTKRQLFIELSPYFQLVFFIFIGLLTAKYV